MGGEKLQVMVPGRTHDEEERVDGKRRREKLVLPDETVFRQKYWLRIRKNVQNFTTVGGVWALSAATPYH